MKLSSLQASLLAIAVFAAAPAAMAQPLMLLAQADGGSVSQEENAVRKFLASGRDVSQMDEEKLQQRLARARRFAESPDLPADLQQMLKEQIAALQSELDRRQQEAGAGQAQPDEQQQADQQQPEQPPQRKKHRKQPEDQPQDQQAQQPVPQIENPPLPPAMNDGGNGDQQASEPPQQKKRKQQQAQETQQQDQQPVATGSPEVAAFLKSARPADGLSEGELRRQMQEAMQLSQTDGISPEQRDALRSLIRETRAALRNPSEQQAQQPPAETRQPDARNVDPALERQAQALLADDTDVRTMKRKQLRRRLADIRDLLASDQLSPQTSEALRQKLARERMVLRNEVAVDEGVPPPAPPPPPRPGQQQGGNVTINNTNMDVRVILNDRRPPDELDDADLVRRIDVYRNVVQDDRYDEYQRMRWQQQMEEDRRFLRQRMIAERRQREARLRSGDIQFNFQVEDRYDPSREVPDDVFAAEVDDSEIADVLSAPPRREIQRRYTLDDIENSPDARNAVARIEIDTVHFGFGEGFLREEEIDKLDRIASVLEKILARHPDEVFVIEGHTDAVGSDQANLVLSRQRAAAVKQALVTYYVIPPGNLRTVGLGERYLKIPTDQPEAENRRVSLARITPLVGQAGD